MYKNWEISKDKNLNSPNGNLYESYKLKTLEIICTLHFQVERPIYAKYFF